MCVQTREIQARFIMHINVWKPKAIKEHKSQLKHFCQVKENLLLSEAIFDTIHDKEAKENVSEDGNDREC